MSSIFSKKSFGTLEKAQAAQIQDFFTQISQGKNVPLDTQDIFKNRKYINTELEHYYKWLKTINPSSFRFVNPEQRRVLREKLFLGFYILSAHLYLDAVEDRKNTVKTQIQVLEKCGEYIQKLEPNSPQLNHDQQVASSNKPVAYLGLTIVAPFLVEKIDELSSGKTEVANAWWNEINANRVFLSRSNNVLLGILRMLPSDFTNKMHGEQVLGTPGPFFGYLSWLLYYIRFGINLTLLLKHTIKGPWMNPEEKNIPTGDRFINQWEFRRFLIINDFIWAHVNLICFFWLTGTALLGYAANILCVTFMTLDIMLALWRWSAEHANHLQNIDKFVEEIENLNQQLINFSGTNAEKNVLIAELTAISKSKLEYELNWKYKNYHLMNDLMYVVGLLAAFSFTSMFLSPPTAIVANFLTFNLIGAVVLFAVTVAYSATTGIINLKKTRELSEITKSEIKVLTKSFLNCNDEAQKALIYLDIRALSSKTEYEEKLIHFQKLQLIRTILSNALLPIIGFYAFVFMPLGIGIGVFAAAFALVKLTEHILNRYAPNEEKLPDFDPEELNAFETALKSTTQSEQTQNFSSFFTKLPNQDKKVIEKGLKPANS